MIPEIEMMQLLWKEVLLFLIKLNLCLPYNPVNLYPGLSQRNKNLCLYTDMYMNFHSIFHLDMLKTKKNSNTLYWIFDSTLRHPIILLLSNKNVWLEWLYKELDWVKRYTISKWYIFLCNFQNLKMSHEKYKWFYLIFFSHKQCRWFVQLMGLRVHCCSGFTVHLWVLHMCVLGGCSPKYIKHSCIFFLVFHVCLFSVLFTLDGARNLFTALCLRNSPGGLGDWT